MIAFDISRFRDLAFGRASLPDHPLQDEDAVHKLIADLPTDPLVSLAELTHWTLSINTDDSFTPEQRGRVLVELDTASHSCWRELAELYLAPDGHPAEGHDGDKAILRALLDSATEFATCYGYSLETGESTSRWTEKNLAYLALRRARWLARRFTLSKMLHLPNSDEIWEDLHLLYALSEERDVWRKVTRVYPYNELTSSVKQEYTRLVMMDMAGLETLLGRDIELAFRVTGRVVASARLELKAIPGAICAIEPRGATRPIAVRLLSQSCPSALYLDTFNCLPRLKALLERNMDADPSDPDTLFGPEYTIRERNASIHRLIDLWGPTPPQRRSKRVPLNAGGLVRGGFDNLVGVIPLLDQGDLKQPENAAPRLQIVFDEKDQKNKPGELKKAIPDTAVRLVNASVAGLGLLVPRKQASWAQLGMLLAVYVEPGPDWLVGMVRRIGAEGQSLRLGISIFSRQPKLVWFHLETTGYASVWAEETLRDRNFLEYFQRGVLIDADRAPLGPGEILLAPGVAGRGSRLDIPFAQGMQRIRITAVREATEHFHRLAFEPLGVTPAGGKQ